MLILNRNYGQSIKIGDKINIKILTSSADQVHIGVEAPRSVTILREEIKYRQPQKKSSEKTEDALKIGFDENKK
ncbi:MAG: carbon storage regulator [Cellvibrionaceae bacterium]|nr:carbon storage regulator [Cellvibrionaceae bacterium]